MVFGAVQCGYRPDVGVVGEGGAVDTLQFQKQIVGTGVAVADGGTQCKQAVRRVADGFISGLIVVDGIFTDPSVVDPGLFQLRHAGGDLPVGPELVVDRNGCLHGGGAVFLHAVFGSRGGEGQRHVS